MDLEVIRNNWNKSDRKQKTFSTKHLSRKAKLAECAIRTFNNGKNTIRPRSLRRLIRAIHDLQNKKIKI